MLQSPIFNFKLKDVFKVVLEERYLYFLKRLCTNPKFSFVPSLTRKNSSTLNKTDKPKSVHLNREKLHWPTSEYKRTTMWERKCLHKGDGVLQI